MFRFYYKIIGLYIQKLAGRGLAGRRLTRLWPGYGPGLGLKRACQARPEPNINSLGRSICVGVAFEQDQERRVIYSFEQYA